MENFPEESTNVIKVSPPSTSSDRRSLIIALFAVLLIIGILTFAAGFLIGKLNYAASNNKISKESSPSAAIAGWSLYKDDEAQFALSHPKEWDTKKHEKSDYEGVKISSKKGYVDLTLLTDQPFSLSEKHQKALDKEEPLEISVGEKKASGTSYKYKAGNYLMVLVLPDTETTPQVTFWLEADEDQTKDEALKIVESFKFFSN
ncbi:MAG: hypothetical protein WD231_03340 [Candidatus Woykebacteria bacterium]